MTTNPTRTEKETITDNEREAIIALTIAAMDAANVRSPCELENEDEDEDNNQLIDNECLEKAGWSREGARRVMDSLEEKEFLAYYKEGDHTLSLTERALEWAEDEIGFVLAILKDYHLLIR